MRIQITGITSNQLNIRRTRNPLYSAAKGIYDGLESLEIGEVRNTPEELNSDTLFYGLYALNSFVSGGFLKTAETLAAAARNNKNVVFFVDDWHLPGIGKSLSASAASVDKYFRFGKKLLGREPTIKEYADVQTSLEYFVSSGAPVIVHVLPWLVNDSECRRNFAEALCVRESRIHLYDPTPLIRWEFPPRIPVGKKKQWVIASRYDFRKLIDKQMLHTWPIEYWGCKKVPGFHETRDEIDLVNLAYRPNWGLVSHPYPPALQGQWRNKFKFAIEAGSIVVAFGKERISTYDRPCLQIEDMDDGELYELAELQKREHNSWVSALRSMEFLKSAARGELYDRFN